MPAAWLRARFRRSLPVGPIYDDVEPFKQRQGELAADSFRGSAKNENDLVHFCAADVSDRLLQDSAVAQGQQLLRSSHAGRAAAGQDNSAYGYPPWI